MLEVPDGPGTWPASTSTSGSPPPTATRPPRSYSLAAPADGDRIEITVQRLADGEVSPLPGRRPTQSATPVEVRGPAGGWFVWRPEDTAPVLLVAGGSGIVPLMAMVRARDGASRAPFRLVYSVRTPEDRIYAHELRRRAAEDGGLDVAWVYTRTAPDGDPRPPGRLTAEDLIAYGWPRGIRADLLRLRADRLRRGGVGSLVAGHDPARSGPSGSAEWPVKEVTPDGCADDRNAVYDGNTLAGPLWDVFAVELTTAAGRCRSCGTTFQVATFRVYGPAPGFVGRCPHCEDVLLRLVRTPDALWLDFSGVSALRILYISDPTHADEEQPP